MTSHNILKTALSKQPQPSTTKGNSADVYFYPNRKIDSFLEEELPETDEQFLKWKNKLCTPENKQVLVPHEKSTGKQLFDKEGKPIWHPSTCGSSYCSDSDCIEARNSRIRLVMGAYYDYALKNKQRVSHAVIGIAHSKRKDLSLDFVKNIRTICQKARPFIVGEIGEKEKTVDLIIGKYTLKRKKRSWLRALGVLDVLYNQEEDSFYFHWHLAIFFPRWHRGNLPYQKINKAINKFGASFHRFEEKNKEVFKLPLSILDYQSKRFTGLLGHPSKENPEFLKYEDYFSSKEYYGLLYRQKKFFTWGYSRKERLEILKDAENRLDSFLGSKEGNNQRFFTREGKEVSYSNVCFLPELKTVFFYVPEKPPDPPPHASKDDLNIEYVRVL